MRRGDKFPPVIAHGTLGKLIMADGNHRLDGALKTNKPLPTYRIIDADGATLMAIAYERNGKHGILTSEEERIEHALRLMDNGADIKTAAAMLTLPRRVLDKASAQHTADERFRKAGLTPMEVEKLSEPIKRRLANIYTDEGFIPMAAARGEPYVCGEGLGAALPPVLTRAAELDGRAGAHRRGNTSSSPLLPLDRIRRRTAVERPHAVAEGSGLTNAWATSSRVAEGFLSGHLSATAAAYASDLRDLFAFAAARGTAPLLLSRVDLHLYVRQLQEERQLAASTVRRRLAAVHQYFRWAVEEGVLTATPAQRLRRPRSDAPPPKVSLTRAEMTALLHAAEAHSSRASVLVQLLLLYGCRIGEVLAADVDDVTGSVTARQLRLLAKGRVVRSLTLLPATADVLDEVIDGRADGPLLRSRSGRRWHRTNAARLLRSIAHSALNPAVADRLHPHALRRAFVDAGLDAGVGLSELQAALGHRSSSMVLVYASGYRADRMPVPHRVATSLQLPEHTHTYIPD